MRIAIVAIVIVALSGVSACDAETVPRADYDALNTRDHLVAWSRVEFLLEREGADLRGFLDGINLRKPEGDATTAAAKTIERQRTALQKSFGLSPAELDEAWATHVKRNYRK